jgi:NodT family efflux transporter outer membrane factor (OMF) lipoprotein
LIARAQESNLDLSVARARVLEARARLEVASGEAGPALGARAGWSWYETSTNTANSVFAPSGPVQLFHAGFDAVWELDLFGYNARGIEAARAGADAALEEGRDVLVSLFAEVARNYVELREAQQQLVLTNSNLALQQDTFELIGVRSRAGFATDFDVARAQAQVANTRAILPQLGLREIQARHRLSVLLGLGPHALDEELQPVAQVPSAPPIAETGVPSDLLRRRADVRRAERELARAAALSAQSTAALFPKLSLSAGLGLDAKSFSKLFDDGSGAFAVSPSLSAPIFNSGALRANVRAQGAAQEAALARYQQTALTALREVEDALAAADRERTRLVALREALESSRYALGLSRELFTRGLADFFEVLAAQTVALEAEGSVVRSEAALATSAIALYKALGGGWEN